MPPESHDYLVRAKTLADERRAAEAREVVGWALAHSSRPSWSGATASGRVWSMRLVSRATLARDPSGTRTAVIATTGLLPVLPFAATGLACADGADGHPWSTWAVAASAGGVIVVLLAGAQAVRWWYGDAFLRRDVAASRFAVLHVGAVVALVGGSLALSPTGATATGWWLALFFGHVGWLIAGAGLSPVLDTRDRRARERGPSPENGVASG